MDREIICSLDIEKGGDNALLNPLYSFGISAFTIEKELLASITFNVDEEPGTAADPKTAAWWQENPPAFAAARANCVPPAHAFAKLEKWWNRLRRFGRAYPAAAPIGGDYSFLAACIWRHRKRPPFERMSLDLRSLVSGMVGKPIYECGKADIAPEMFDDLPHTHVSLDDSIEQGALFVNLLRASRGLPRISGIRDCRAPEDTWDATSHPALRG